MSKTFLDRAADSMQVSFAFMQNPVYKRCFGSNLAIGDTDLYTCPVGKRALLLPMVRAYNPSAGSITFFPELKVSGTYYRIGSSVVLTTVTGVQAGFFIPGAMVFNAGESISINSTTTVGLNVTLSICEFDTASKLSVARILALANGDNILYIVTTGKSASIANNTGAIPVVNIVNSSGASRNYTLHNVPFGGAAGTTNQLFPTTAQADVTGASYQGFSTLDSGDFIVVRTNSGTAGQVAWTNYEER